MRDREEETKYFEWERYRKAELLKTHYCAECGTQMIFHEWNALEAELEGTKQWLKEFICPNCSYGINFYNPYHIDLLSILIIDSGEKYAVMDATNSTVEEVKAWLESDNINEIDNYSTPATEYFN